MFGLFGKRTFLEADLEAWVLETYAWLMRHFGGMADLADPARLATPEQFALPARTRVSDIGPLTFERVKAHMGMSEWQCQLVPVEVQRETYVGGHVHLEHDGRAEGTFESSGNEIIISYDEGLARQPLKLVAVLAHELSHYLLATAPEEWPGGEEAHELATELCVAYCGFGIFSANSAFDFSQYGDAFGQGWQYSTSGYFSERTWALAIAIGLVLSGRQCAADAHLKDSVADLVRKAEQYLARKPELLAPLRALP